MTTINLDDFNKLNKAEQAKVIAALNAENAVLRQQAKTRPEPSYKATDKGQISIYNLQRFPVTLGPDQWRQVYAILPEVLEFCDKNADTLKARRDAAKAAARAERRDASIA